MKVSILDRATLAALRPLDVTAYLRASGWREAASEGARLKHWHKDDASNPRAEGFYVEQPLHSDWRDYHVLMRFMLDTLAEVEKRSQLSIVQDLTEVSADVVRLRAEPAGISDGTIALQDSRRLVDCAHRAVLAAACAAIEPKRAYHTRKPKTATDYADTLRAGQTERGSYVVTVISRVSPALEPPQLALPIDGAAPVTTRDPFERSVMLTLATALEKVQAAALDSVASQSMTAFEQAIPFGVSADLCEALALLRDSPVITRLDVRISWAPARPVPRTVPGPVTFTPDTFEVLREAGRHLRDRGTIDGFELSGPVVGQTRPDQAQISGDVTIATRIDGKDRKVVVELMHDDWTTALEAMAKGWILRCEGELDRDVKPARLRNARGVRAIPTEDDV